MYEGHGGWEKFKSAVNVHVYRVSPVCPQWVISAIVQWHNHKGLYIDGLTQEIRLCKMPQRWLTPTVQFLLRCHWDTFTYMFSTEWKQVLYKETNGFSDAAFSRFMVMSLKREDSYCWSRSRVKVSLILNGLQLFFFNQDEWEGYYFCFCSCIDDINTEEKKII